MSEVDEIEDDDIDDEEIWNWICQTAAQRAGISTERAKAILEDAGFVAHYHTGIGEAVEVVRWEIRPAMPPQEKTGQGLLMV
jgi:hypothetical protein